MFKLLYFCHTRPQMQCIIKHLLAYEATLGLSLAVWTVKPYNWNCKSHKNTNYTLATEIHSYRLLVSCELCDGEHTNWIPVSFLSVVETRGSVKSLSNKATAVLLSVMSSRGLLFCWNASNKCDINKPVQKITKSFVQVLFTYTQKNENTLKSTKIRVFVK